MANFQKMLEDIKNGLPKGESPEEHQASELVDAMFNNEEKENKMEDDINKPPTNVHPDDKGIKGVFWVCALCGSLDATKEPQKKKSCGECKSPMMPFTDPDEAKTFCVKVLDKVNENREKMNNNKEKTMDDTNKRAIKLLKWTKWPFIKDDKASKAWPLNRAQTRALQLVKVEGGSMLRFNRDFYNNSNNRKKLHATLEAMAGHLDGLYVTKGGKLFKVTARNDRKGTFVSVKKR